MSCERCEKLNQRLELTGVEREVRDNKQEIDILRLLDLIDGLLCVAAALGERASGVPLARILRARAILAGKP